MTVTIRPEAPQDAAAIEAVTTAAFVDAPHTNHAEQHVVNALRAAGQLSISLVAELDGAVIGHVAVSPVSITDSTRNWFGLGPISVVPGMQRRGVGSQLVREALRRLGANGAAGCVVLGDPGYYGRFGFHVEPELILRGVPAQCFQALALGSVVPRGVVNYHPAFDARTPSEHYAAGDAVCAPEGHVLDTERLTLRLLEATDAGFLVELMNDPDWLRNIGDRGIRNAADARNHIANGPRAMYARHGFGLYRVELRDGGTPVGLCGLIRRDWLEDVDLGFAFLPQYRGRGYAFEAASATLAYGRTALGLARITAIVSPANRDSIRLLGRLGMRFERWVTAPGEAQPIWLMALPTGE